MIRALIFDFDGLILDTESPLRASWSEIYSEHELRIPDAVWAGLLGASADPPEMYQFLEDHLGHPVDRDALRKRRLVRELELLEHEGLMPGVTELLDAADTKGLRTAVASSSEREWVVGHLARLGILDRFDAIVCAEDVPQTKPDPALYLEALRRLHTAPNEAIAFEDSDHGSRAASAAGIYCVAVPNRVTRGSAFPHADCVVSSLAACSLDELAVAAVKRNR